MKRHLFLLCLLAPLCLPAQTPPIQADSLTKRVDAILKKHKTPGVQVLVFTKDSLLYKHNAGVANLKTKMPITDQSMFRLGSITKSFVAVSALMLVEKGQLNLSDELKKLAPEITFTNQWEATDPVRVVHLLEHTTGFDDWSMQAYAYKNDATLSLEKGLTMFTESRHSRWRPGAFMSYCNTGPPVVARLIEKKTGQEYESWMKERVFTPLGQKTITFRNDGAALKHLVTDHSGSEDSPVEEPFWHVMMRPAGSLNAPALELMPFVQMLMNRGTYRGQQLLQPAFVDRMELPTTALSARAGSKQGYGLHNYTTSYKGYVFHGHDGGVNGGLAHYRYNTELNLGFVVLVNSGGGGFGEINDALLDVLLKTVPQRLPPAHKLADADKEKLLGYYRASNPRNEKTYFLEWLGGVMRVYEQDRKLFIKSLLGGEAEELRPMAPNRFVRLDKKGYTSELTLTQNDENDTVLIGPWMNTTATSALGAWLPIVLGVLALLMLAVTLVAGVVWLVQYVRGRHKARPVSVMPVRMSLWGYALSFAGMAAILASLADGFELGIVGLPTLTVLVASVLTALFALAAAVLLIRSGRRVRSGADRVFLWVLVGSALLVVGYMLVWGLVGLQTWN
ncbi:MAG: class A beta-lactamase-related serine hydrolase [Cytophagales bacterium]|nr:MAG: class A beta-lactamase-related serine hydrolase [Cytophagales bacterium]